MQSIHDSLYSDVILYIFLKNSRKVQDYKRHEELHFICNKNLRNKIANQL